MTTTELKRYCIDALVRAFKTFFQSLVGFITAGQLFLGDVNWLMTVSASALSAVVSLAQSAASLPWKDLHKEEDTQDKYDYEIEVPTKILED